PERAQDRLGGSEQIALDGRVLRRRLRGRTLLWRGLFPAAQAGAAQRPAFPRRQAERPGERVALRIVLARAREDLEQRGLRGVLAVRLAGQPHGERAELRPQE